MKRKVSELIGLLEQNLVEEVEEIEVSEKMVAVIKARALEKANEKDQKTPRTLKRVWKKPFAFAAVLTLIIVTAVGAISISKSLQEFFGENLQLLLSSTQEIGRSISQNGIKMTVETAIGGNSGGLVILNLTKEDGSSFKKESELKKLSIQVEESGSTSYHHGWQLSEDAKRLTYIINLKCSSNIARKNVTIKGEDLVIVSPKEEVMALDFAELAKEKETTHVERSEKKQEATLYQQDKKEERVEATIEGRRDVPEGISLRYPYSDIVLKDIGFSEEGFYIETELTYAEDDVWQMFRIIDTRTGKTIDYDTSRGHSSSTYLLQSDKKVYKSIHREDLPYIQLVRMHNEYETVIEGQWEISFTLHENKNVKKSDKKYVVQLEWATLELLDIELSAVGGSIEGIFSFDKTIEAEESGRLYYEIDISLHYKDGTVLPMTQIMNSSAGNGGRYSSYIEVGRPLHDYTKEEQRKLREELIEKAGQDKTRGSGGIEYILTKEFIDVEQIESIQIEDTIIPLK